MEFAPLGMPPDAAGLTLHETGYLPRNDWWNFPNVLSPFWRLLYNFDRGHKCIFADGETELTPAHLVIIPDYQLFHCFGEVPVRCFWCTFSVARGLDPEQQIPILLKPSAIELGMIRRMCEWISPKQGTPLRDNVPHYSLALLHIVLARPELRWRSDSIHPGIKRAAKIMKTRFADPLKIPELAAEAQLSETAFRRRFHEEMHASPSQYLIQVRVREAMHLLANTELGLETIAEKTGFPDRAYLSRVFKKITGYSPANFRRSHLPGQRGVRPGHSDRGKHSESGSK
jgi:AraC-like DNA-binding protein